MIGSDVVIDISHWNEPVDFDAIAKWGIVGVIHKATQGSYYSDPTFQRRRQQAIDAGLLWGAFHFGDGSDPINQRDHFLGTVGMSHVGVDLLALDFERNPQGLSMSLDQAASFNAAVLSEVRRLPKLYGGDRLRWLTIMQALPLTKCGLWLSQYGASPVPPKGWDDWKLWQYTDNHVGPWANRPVPGVGLCDRSTFNGSVSELRDWWVS